jgi:hypothetical protein
MNTEAFMGISHNVECPMLKECRVKFTPELAKKIGSIINSKNPKCPICHSQSDPFHPEDQRLKRK